MERTRRLSDDELRTAVMGTLSGKKSLSDSELTRAINGIYKYVEAASVAEVTATITALVSDGKLERDSNGKAKRRR